MGCKNAFFFLMQNMPLSHNCSNPMLLLYTKKSYICVTKCILITKIKCLFKRIYIFYGHELYYVFPFLSIENLSHSNNAVLQFPFLSAANTTSGSHRALLYRTDLEKCAHQETIIHESF